VRGNTRESQDFRCGYIERTMRHRVQSHDASRLGYNAWIAKVASISTFVIQRSRAFALFEVGQVLRSLNEKKKKYQYRPQKRHGLTSFRLNIKGHQFLFFSSRKVFIEFRYNTTCLKIHALFTFFLLNLFYYLRSMLANSIK